MTGLLQTPATQKGQTVDPGNKGTQTFCSRIGRDQSGIEIIGMQVPKQNTRALWKSLKMLDPPEWNALKNDDAAIWQPLGLIIGDEAAILWQMFGHIAIWQVHDDDRTSGSQQLRQPQEKHRNTANLWVREKKGY
ncbi:MAG: hypothetical protein H7834_08240 [Magnetococcus sp. YQC-9]